MDQLWWQTPQHTHNIEEQDAPRGTQNICVQSPGDPIVVAMDDVSRSGGLTDRQSHPSLPARLKKKKATAQMPFSLISPRVIWRCYNRKATSIYAFSYRGETFSPCQHTRPISTVSCADCYSGRAGVLCIETSKVEETKCSGCRCVVCRMLVCCMISFCFLFAWEGGCYKSFE